MTLQQRAPISSPLACSLVRKHKMRRRRPPTSTAFCNSALALFTLVPLLCGAGHGGGEADSSAPLASPEKDVSDRPSSVPQRRVALGAEPIVSRSTGSADAFAAERRPPARGPRQGKRGTRPRRPAPLPGDGDTREEQPAAPAETPSITPRPQRRPPSAASPRHRPAVESSSSKAVAAVPVGRLPALGPPFHVVNGGPGERIYANLPSGVFLRFVHSLCCQSPLQQQVQQPSHKPPLHQTEQPGASQSRSPEPATSKIQHGDVPRLPDTQRSVGPQWSQPTRFKGGSGVGRAPTGTRDNTSAPEKGYDEASGAEGQQDGGRPRAIRPGDERTEGQCDQRALGAGSAGGQAAEQRSGALRGSDPLHKQSQHGTLEANSRPPAAGALPSETWPTRDPEQGRTPPLTCEKFTQTKSKFFRGQRTRTDDSSAFHGAPRPTAEASNWPAMMPPLGTRCVPLQTAEAAYLPSGYRLHTWPLGGPPECVRVPVHETSAFDQESAPVIGPVPRPSTRHQSTIVLGAEGTWAAAAFPSHNLGDPACLSPPQHAMADDDAVVRGAEGGGAPASLSLGEPSDHGHPPFLSPFASFPLERQSVHRHLISLPPLETGENWVAQVPSGGPSAIPVDGTYQALQSMKIAGLYPCDAPYGCNAATATTFAVQGAPQPPPPIVQSVASGGEPAPFPPACSRKYTAVPIAQPPISGCWGLVPPPPAALAFPCHPPTYHPTHDPRYFPCHRLVPGFPHVPPPGHAQPAALEPADAAGCPQCSRRSPPASGVASVEPPQFAPPDEEVALQPPPS